MLHISRKYIAHTAAAAMVLACDRPYGTAEERANEQENAELGPAVVIETAAEVAAARKLSMARAERLATSLRAAGYDVELGKMKFFRVEDCELLPKCYGNNPSSPYGLYMLPPAPGEAPLDDLPPPLVDGSLRAGWRLREDEAVVMLGKLPSARYYGFRSYLYQRDGRDLFASLGDTLNPLLLGAEASGQTAVVTTADARVDNGIRSLLEADGMPREAINTDVVPRDLVRMGLDASADVLTMLFRVASVGNPQSVEAYVAAPPVTVLRVRPKTIAAIAPLAAPPARLRGTGTNEDGLRPALARLDLAIARAHPKRVEGPSFGIAPPLDGPRCVALGVPCLGDNRDTLYYVAPGGTLSAAPDDFYVVWGVNHTRAGKATYTNVAAYDLGRQLGVGGLTDPDLEGSAQRYLPGDPDAASLYAVRFARTCSPKDRTCFAVPTTFPGVALDAKVSFIVRPYLEPKTRTGPAADELLAPRIMHVGPP